LLFTVKKLMFTIAAFAATTAFAEEAQVYVPFNFEVKAKTFPTGTYRVVMDMNDTVITLYNVQDPDKVIKMMAEPTNRVAAETVLRFTVLGADHSLKNVQVGSRISSTLNTTAKTKNSPSYLGN
jgi:hypothetical protein